MSKIKTVIESLENLKLTDIMIYDMRERSPFFEYFVISTASNTRQLQAAIHHLKEDLALEKYDQPMVEGASGGSWILVDAKDIVINVFTADERKYYNIEKMWMDVPQIDKDALE